MGELIWNYRVIRHSNRASPNEHWFAVHVVFYDEKGEIVSYIQNPEYCCSNDFAALCLQADMIKDACHRDILIASRVDRSIEKLRRRTELHRQKDASRARKLSKT